MQCMRWALWMVLATCCIRAQALSPVMDCPEVPVFFPVGGALPVTRLLERGRLEDVLQADAEALRGFLAAGRTLQVIGRASEREGPQSRSLAEHRAFAMRTWLGQERLSGAQTTFYAQIETTALVAASVYAPASGIVGCGSGCLCRDQGTVPASLGGFYSFAESIDYGF